MGKLTLYIIIAVLVVLCIILFLLWYSVYTKPDKRIASSNAIIRRKISGGYEAISVSSEGIENTWSLKTGSILNIGEPIELIVFRK